jgi:Type II secretion system (T2SS), protein E, N-terminal domain
MTSATAIMTSRPADESKTGIPESPPEASARPRRLLGELLVDEGLISRSELDAALKVQAAHPHTPIGQILVERGVIKREQIDAVFDKHRLGNLLVSMGVITSEQLESALWRQRVTGRRLAEVLLKLRYIGEDQLRQALARHYKIGLVDLDTMVLDRSLAGVIERDYAWEHRLVPVGLVGDRLTVAMDDPGDRWVVTDLARITGRRIEVVTAASAALRRAFTRIYRDGEAAATAGALEARHVETRRILAAVGATSQQIRLGPR